MFRPINIGFEVKDKQKGGRSRTFPGTVRPPSPKRDPPSAPPLPKKDPLPLSPNRSVPPGPSKRPVRPTPSSSGGSTISCDKRTRKEARPTSVQSSGTGDNGGYDMVAWVKSGGPLDRDILIMEQDKAISDYHHRAWEDLPQVEPDNGRSAGLKGRDSRRIQLGNTANRSRDRMNPTVTGQIYGLDKQRELVCPEASVVHSGRRTVHGDWNIDLPEDPSFAEDWVKKDASPHRKSRATFHKTFRGTEKKGGGRPPIVQIFREDELSSALAAQSVDRFTSQKTNKLR